MKKYSTIDALIAAIKSAINTLKDPNDIPATVTVIAVSTTNGLAWQDVWRNDKTGRTSASLRLVERVSGSYEVLVKVTLMGKSAAGDPLTYGDPKATRQ